MSCGIPVASPLFAGVRVVRRFIQRAVSAARSGGRQGRSSAVVSIGRRVQLSGRALVGTARPGAMAAGRMGREPKGEKGP